LLGFHARVVRHFLMRLAQDLLAHDLGRQHAVGQVGELILGEHPGAGLHRLRQLGAQPSRPLFFSAEIMKVSAKGSDFVAAAPTAAAAGLAVDQVHLVQRQPDGPLLLGQPLDDAAHRRP
jgi:hypothetical protein